MYIIITILSLLSIGLSQVCSADYFFNGQRCAPCKPNCQCSQQNTCTKCLSGYTFDSLFQNCLRCPLQTSMTDLGCKQCCFQIKSTQYVCSECPSLPYVFLKGSQCLNQPGCLQMQDNGLCSLCDSGYYISSWKCLSCHASCQTCIDSTYCTLCKQGYYNQTSNVGLSYCTQCPLGCSSCTSATVCLVCSNGYRLSGTSCVGCSANCNQCSSSQCTTCAVGYTVIGTSCASCSNTTVPGGSAGCLQCTTSGSSISCTLCTLGYVLINSTCVSCSSRYPNSILCNTTNPLQCSNDQSSNLTARYYLFNGICVQNINSCRTMKQVGGGCSDCYFSTGLNYMLVNNACIKCSVANCNSYTTSCVCTSCESGYQFINNQCVGCQNLHCSSCVNNVQSCSKCNSGYGLFSSACAQCTKSNCYNCDGDFNKCTECLVGYYLDDNLGDCYACQTTCTSCTSSTKCLTCAAGSYLTLDYRCKRLPNNCVQVNTNGQCVKCGYGYMVIQKNCYNCGLDLLNLDKCQRYCPSYYSSKFQYQLLMISVWLIVMSIVI